MDTSRIDPRRFGHGTVKMVRQAQSREKLLQKKLEEGLTEKPQRDAEWDFSFPDPGELPTPVLMIQDVSFAYPNSEPLYHNLDLGIDLQSRIALVGPNGAGKTTFVKLMTGELQPTSGAVRPHSHLRMAKFTQHFEDVLDLEQNALEWIHSLYPKVFTKLEMARTWLGRYGCTAKQQEMPMKQLSDGQKARIVFAKLAMDKPHLLMLDEPTNHLQRPVSCISPFRRVEAPSLHSNASSPGEEAVGGLVSDLEPILMVLSAQGHGVDRFIGQNDQQLQGRARVGQSRHAVDQPGREGDLDLRQEEGGAVSRGHLEVQARGEEGAAEEARPARQWVVGGRGVIIQVYKSILTRCSSIRIKKFLECVDHARIIERACLLWSVLSASIIVTHN